MGQGARTLGLLLTLITACVINTRPHLPLEDDGGRTMAVSDASAAFDAGVLTGATGDTGATDLGVASDGAPPAATPDGAARDDADNGFELDDCLSADADRGDGGTDGGDARVRGDGGDAGFTDSRGRPCDPAARRDASVRDGSDARSGP